MRLLSRTARFGHFEIFSRLGFGGMGEVFRARLRGAAGRDVALKLIKPEYSDDPHFHALFLAEGHIGALLDHPNVARMLDFGEVEGTHYLASELVEGASLAELEKEGPLPLEVAVYIAGGVLDALDYAHDLCDERGRPIGLVHRDISPSNVMLSASGEVKLIDFGVAKLPSHSLTRANEVKGKESYMAPEQRGRETVDRRADLYSLGIVLHEMIAGARPRVGVPLAVAGAVGDAIERAVALDAAARFASARELAEALRRAVPPTDAARADLARRVSAIQRTERPLAAVERMLMVELAEDEQPLPLVYAPDPTTRRLWLLASDAHSEEITRPEGLAASFALDATIPLAAVATSPLPTAPEPTTAATTQLRSRLQTAKWAVGAALALAGACGFFFGLLRDPSPRRDTPEPIAAVPASAPEAPRAPAPAPQPAATVIAPVPNVERATAATSPIVSPPAPHPRPDRGVAWLTLDSEPWAVVYVDKRRLGTTPFMHIAIPAGRNELTFDVQGSGHRLRRVVDVPRSTHKRIVLALP